MANSFILLANSPPRRFVFRTCDNWTNLFFFSSFLRSRTMIFLILILNLDPISNRNTKLCWYRHIYSSIILFLIRFFSLPVPIPVYRVCMRGGGKKYWAVAVFHPFALSNIFVCPLSVTLSNLPAFLSYGEPEGFPSPSLFSFFTFLSRFVTYLNESWMGGKLIWILNYLISRRPPLFLF